MAVMARRTTTTPPPEDFEENIVDIDVTEEMRASYLEYAYSVIYQRALPDARDGLKPVQRRILYQMAEMGLTPQRAHVKCARVVGEVMGRLHPHGDSAIYDALVRMAQPLAMRLPLIDGHGNFGSLGGDDSAGRVPLHRGAAGRRGRGDDGLAGRGHRRLRAELRRPRRPSPRCFPPRSRTCSSTGPPGSPSGMATNMAPHNLGEVVAAARHLIAHPDAEPGRADAVRARARPAHRRQDRRAGRDQGGLRDRARHIPHPGGRPDREAHPAPHRDRGHRAALRDRPGEGRSPGSRTWSRPRSWPASPTSRTSPTGTAACSW